MKSMKTDLITACTSLSKRIETHLREHESALQACQNKLGTVQNTINQLSQRLEEERQRYEQLFEANNCYSTFCYSTFANDAICSLSELKTWKEKVTLALSAIHRNAITLEDRKYLDPMMLTEELKRINAFNIPYGVFSKIEQEQNAYKLRSDIERHVYQKQSIEKSIQARQEKLNDVREGHEEIQGVIQSCIRVISFLDKTSMPGISEIEARSAKVDAHAIEQCEFLALLIAATNSLSEKERALLAATPLDSTTPIVNPLDKEQTNAINNAPLNQPAQKDPRLGKQNFFEQKLTRTPHKASEFNTHQAPPNLPVQQEYKTDRITDPTTIKKLREEKRIETITKQRKLDGGTCQSIFSGNTSSNTLHNYSHGKNAANAFPSVPK